MDLKDARVRIDQLDRQILDLLQQRMHVVEDVARYKQERGLPVLDASREKEKLEELAAMSEEGMAEYMKIVYNTIMKVSRDYQRELIGEELS